MSLPAAETPLYNHPLPDLERWLESQGCAQDETERECWHVQRETWAADIELAVEEIVVRYLKAGSNGQDIQRAFPYSLSRQDVEAAIFEGP
ncbi:MAG: DUF3143 domain-containing protein [Cyanobacteria bacterium P01_H01_bin.121]